MLSFQFTRWIICLCSSLNSIYLLIIYILSIENYPSIIAQPLVSCPLFPHIPIIFTQQAMQTKIMQTYFKLGSSFNRDINLVFVFYCAALLVISSAWEVPGLAAVLSSFSMGNITPSIHLVSMWPHLLRAHERWSGIR